MASFILITIFYLFFSIGSSKLPSFEESMQNCAVKLEGDYGTTNSAITEVIKLPESFCIWLVSKNSCEFFPNFSWYQGKNCWNFFLLYFQNPWAVFLFDDATNHTFCSGSIVSSQSIITAAHCFFNKNLNDIKIYFGYGQSLEEIGENGYRPSEPEFIRSIENHFDHPNYKLGVLYNDIAIVTFSEPLVFNSKVRPICLPTQQKEKVQYTLTIQLWSEQ